MEEYSWVTAVGAHWAKIEADYNVEWSSMAYLDGPGYTVMDRIEAKLDLRRKYFSRSSSHGVVNSPKEILPKPIESHHISSVAESNRHSNLRMAEYTREIQESCARILKLLQEEIDASESLDVDASESYTKQITATPYATDKFSSSEVLCEVFLAVDALNFKRDSVIDQLIADSDVATIPSIVEHDCGGKNAGLHNKSSSVVTDPGVSNVTVALFLPEILPPDPPDIVPVPPPPLAPPWPISPTYSHLWHQQYSIDFLRGISKLLSTFEGGISSFNWMTLKPLATFTPQSPTVTCFAFFSAATHVIFVGSDDSTFVISHLCEYMFHLTREGHLTPESILGTLWNPLPVCVVCVSADIDFPNMFVVLSALQFKVFFEWGFISTFLENMFSVGIIIHSSEFGGIIRSTVIIVLILNNKQGYIHNAYNMFERLSAQAVKAWPSLIAGGASLNLQMLALSVFLEMVQLDTRKSYLGYKHIYLKNSIYAKVLLHPHPHNAFQSLINDNGMSTDSVSKHSAKVGVVPWYYDPIDIMPWGSGSNGVLFWCTSGWIQQYLHEKYCIVTKRGNIISLIGIPFILEKLQKLPPAHNWVHLLSNWTDSYHGHGFEIVAVLITGTCFSIFLGNYYTCCYTNSLLLSVKFPIAIEFMPDGPLHGLYESVLTVFVVLLLVEFSSITKCWHERETARRKGKVKVMIQQRAMSWLDPANANFAVGDIVFSRAHDCNSKSILTCFDTTQNVFWRQYFPSPSCLNVLICCLVSHFVAVLIKGGILIAATTSTSWKEEKHLYNLEGSVTISCYMLLDGEFVAKVADSGVTNVVTFVSKGTKSLLINLGPYGFVAPVRMGKRRQWDPGGCLEMSKVLYSLQFKPCGSGKSYSSEQFYNLEDKVDFDGEGNVMILESSMTQLNLEGSISCYNCRFKN